MDAKKYKIYLIVEIISIIISFLCIEIFVGSFFFVSTQSSAELEVFFEKNINPIKVVAIAVPILTLISIVVTSHCGGRIERYKQMEEMFNQSKLMKYREDLITDDFIKKELELKDESCQENHEKLKEEIYYISEGITKLGDSYLNYVKKAKFKDSETANKMDSLYNDLSTFSEKMEKETDLNENGINLLKEEIKIAKDMQKSFDRYIYKSNFKYEYSNQTSSRTSRSYDYTYNNVKRDEKVIETSSNNKKLTPEEKRSRERYSDDELTNFYGLEQEQIDELRENDLDPWNFNEEELTPEDFYYHDDFYQDKIKRGEEKEEP